MTTKIHVDAITDGLNVIVNATISIAICQTEPLTVADCTALSGSGGKRVTSEVGITGLIILEQGVNAESVQLPVPSTNFNNGILVAVAANVADLWLAVYDGTRLLLKSNQIANVEMIIGQTVTSPRLRTGVQQ